jgi:hypothetical protein
VSDTRAVKQELRGIGFHESYEVRTFKGWRRHKLDEDVQVTVEVWDAGADASDGRDFVVARDAECREASGNPHATIDMTIRGVHWFDLDQQRD